MTTEPFDPVADPDNSPADLPDPDAPDRSTADPIAPMDPDQTSDTPDTDSGLT